VSSDVERELKQVEALIEELERNTTEDEDENPDSTVPAPVKPKPLRNGGAVALPEPD